MQSLNYNLLSRRPSRGRVQPRCPQKAKPQIRHVRSTMNLSSASHSNVSYLNSSMAELRSPVIDFTAARLIKIDDSQRNKNNYPRQGSRQNREVIREIDRIERNMAEIGRQPYASLNLRKSHSSPHSFRLNETMRCKFMPKDAFIQRAANVTPTRINSGCVGSATRQTSSHGRPGWNNSTRRPKWSPRRKLATSHTNEHSHAFKAAPAFSSKPRIQFPMRLAPHRLNESVLGAPRGETRPKSTNKPSSSSTSMPRPKPGTSQEAISTGDVRNMQPGLNGRLASWNDDLRKKSRSGVKEQTEAASCSSGKIFEDAFANAPQSLQLHRKIFNDIISQDLQYGKTLAKIRDAYEEAFRSAIANNALVSMKEQEETQVLQDELSLLKLRAAKAQKEQKSMAMRVQQAEEGIRGDQLQLQQLLDRMTRHVAGENPAPVPKGNREKHEAFYQPQHIVRVRPPVETEQPSILSPTALEEFEALEFESLPRPTPRQVERPECVPRLSLDAIHSDMDSIPSANTDTVRISELMGSYRTEESRETVSLASD